MKEMATIQDLDSYKEVFAKWEARSSQAKVAGLECGLFASHLDYLSILTIYLSDDIKSIENSRRPASCLSGGVP
jgi:hypothetical protein